MKNSYMRSPVWVLAGVFGFLLLLNVLMPLHRDDYDYALIWGTNRPIASFSDVFQSLRIHYMDHGGRMVAFFFLDTFLWWGKSWFNVANAAIFTGLAVLLLFHGIRQTSLRGRGGLLAVTAFFMWIGLPHFGEVAVWECGSTVYLWTGFLAALFLLPYNLYFAGEGMMSSRYAVPFFFLGLLAGWSVENLSVTVVLLAWLSVYGAWRQGRKEVWMFSGGIGAFIGAVLLIMAPGNYVRYGVQGESKGWLVHVGNQFAGNGEMFLYVLPLFLAMLMAYRSLKRQVAEGGSPSLEKGRIRLTTGQMVTSGFLTLLVASYFTGGWCATWIQDVLLAHVMTPLGLTKAKTVEHFVNMMNGFEEMLIYLLAVGFVYSVVKQAFYKGRVEKPVSWRSVVQAYPSVRYTAVLMGFGFFTNFVMLAAPTFPVRATFGAVCFFIVAGLSLFALPAVQNILWQGAVKKILFMGVVGLGGFLAVAAVVVSCTVYHEDARRMAYIQMKAGSGDIVALPPLSLQDRALRHVFYVDFHNGVTKNPVVRYFGLGDIVVSPHATLPDEA